MDLTLPLDCEACGQRGPHAFRMALLSRRMAPLAADAPAEETATAERFGPVIIPHPVTCPHCGAVQQYHVVPKTVARLRRLAWSLRLTGQGWRVKRLYLTTHVGNDLHPLVAAVRYRSRLAAHPHDAQVHAWLANAWRSAGYWTEARHTYRTLLDRRSVPLAIRLEAAFNLALLAGCENDRIAMGAFVRRGIALARRPDARKSQPLTTHTGQVGVHQITDSIRDLLFDLAHPDGLNPDAILRRFFADTTVRHVPRIDPRAACPCGSGFTYGRCCRP